MKQSIEWHEECLTNMKRNMENKITNIKYMEDELAKIEASCTALKNQIEIAKKEKKTGFDREKYCKSRSKTC